MRGADPHTSELLQEVRKEASLGRMVGPWPSIPDEAFAAKAFPINQESEGRVKVRRGDDWLRSHHNSTVWACDSPPYAGPEAVLQQLCFVAKSQGQLLLAAADHEGAYRMLPVFRSLSGEKHAEIWCHAALPFGASGSVWAYCRVADCLTFMVLALVLVPASHFVDDYSYSQHEQFSDSGRSAFLRFNRLLGFQMKESKSKPPSAKQTLLGLEWEISPSEVIISPGSERISQVLQLIEQHLQKGVIAADKAASLTGKLQFVAGWSFGHVGRALLRPLYARQYSVQAEATKLSPGLKAALLACCPC